MVDAIIILQYALMFVSLYFAILFFLFFLSRYHKMPELGKTDWRPLITVIIPAFNEEKYIKNCILSVLDADYPKDKLEVLVIDDGSKDKTSETAREVNDKRVKVFKKENSGKGATLNFGIEKSKGDLIAILDADSYIKKDTIMRMLPLFYDDNVAAVTAAVKIRESKNWIKEFQRVEYLFILFMRRILSFFDAVPVTPGPFSMYRSKVLKKLGGFDEHNLVEDHEMALRIQSHHYKIRSSLTADVLTEVPDGISALMKQRVRWQKGGILNVINYRRMMHPKYGDFGVLILPLTIISFILVFAIAFIAIYSIFNPPHYSELLGIEAFFIGANPLTLVAMFLFLLSIFWAYGAIKSFKNESANIPLLLGYLVLYWFFSLAYNTVWILKMETIRTSY